MRTVDERYQVHSLHGYFLRPGNPNEPTVFTVDRIRDGRSFATRRVTGIQDGKAIFTMSASFHVEDEGIEGVICGRAIYSGDLDFAAAQTLADRLRESDDA